MDLRTETEYQSSAQYVPTAHLTCVECFRDCNVTLRFCYAWLMLAIQVSFVHNAYAISRCCCLACCSHVCDLLVSCLASSNVAVACCTVGHAGIHSNSSASTHVQLGVQCCKPACMVCDGWLHDV